MPDWTHAGGAHLFSSLEELAVQNEHLESQPPVKSLTALTNVRRFFRQFLMLFFLHQMSLGLFRFLASLGRTLIIANTWGTFSLLVVFVLGGFIVSRGKQGNHGLNRVTMGLTG